MNKKYYSISETAEILGVKAHNLRYMDDLLGKKLTRIRGRRYYREQDIEILKKALQTEAKMQPTIISINDDKIGNMISKLEALKSQLEAV